MREEGSRRGVWSWACRALWPRSLTCTAAALTPTACFCRSASIPCLICICRAMRTCQPLQVQRCLYALVKVTIWSGRGIVRQFPYISSAPYLLPDNWPALLCPCNSKCLTMQARMKAIEHEFSLQLCVYACMDFLSLRIRKTNL